MRSELITSSNFTNIIDNFREKIISSLKETHPQENPLFENFVRNFYSFIPLDYIKDENISFFSDVVVNAYEFFKSRNPHMRKVELEYHDEVCPNTITLKLINDNKPFLVDSLKSLLSNMEIDSQYLLHPIMRVKRNDKGELLEILNSSSLGHSAVESLIIITIYGNYDKNLIKSLKSNVEDVLSKIENSVSFSPTIDKRVDEFIESMNKNLQEDSRVAEIYDFLKWLKADHFHLFCFANFNAENKGNILDHNIEHMSGIDSIFDKRNTSIVDEAISLSLNDKNNNEQIVFGKLRKVSPLHRNTFLDYILIKNIDSKGQCTGGNIIIGLYSAMVNFQAVKEIPVFRNNLQRVVEKSGFTIVGYNAKKLHLIIESLPREALFQFDKEDLFAISMSVLSAMTTKNLKLFCKKDASGQFINALLFMPRSSLTPDIHEQLNEYLSNFFNSKIYSNTVSVLHQDFVFLYMVFDSKDFDLDQIDQVQMHKDLEEITSHWEDKLLSILSHTLGFLKDIKTLRADVNIFPKAYKQKFLPQIAIKDLPNIKQATAEHKTIFNLDILNGVLNLRIYNPDTKLKLSEMMPLLENLGFEIYDEQTFEIKASEETSVFLHEFNLSSTSLELENFADIKDNVEEALDRMFSGFLANDSLSKLTVTALMGWKQITVIRALTRYLHQTNFAYGKGYVQLTLLKHHNFTLHLVKLFESLLHPEKQSEKEAEFEKSYLEEYLNKVESNAEDKVLRALLAIVLATLRTNVYQKSKDGHDKKYMSFKFDPELIPGLAKPIPFREIFVYSNIFEGVHLRGGAVSRGGLRWSDRGEDYRTEVHGLMKAQKTKNAVIVPDGAKGGFYVKYPSNNISHEEKMRIGVECYKDFLRGLLDITDNLVHHKVKHPENTVIRDNKDYYLVVAADKGTASFSDYANSISKEYNFWLGDAFASGGSAGYDHKKMAITARGGWVAVQRHFAEMGINVQKDPVTVIGIGDMSGDVFGNGMLLSKSIKLVAAFNHMHIFIDPNPDPAISFQERKRLFNLPRSKWSDYDASLISQGGGIFERSAKKITLSQEAQTLLDLKTNIVTPDELIKAILCAPADLLWNGGIGTYVKAHSEAHLEVGDKANDSLRVDGRDLRVKVVGEGGNLGFTQLGRIEYARNGGRINTDFIDNSAGVDCSDHEVNIKIVLQEALNEKKIDLPSRDALLESMTDEVAKLVLIDNWKQTEAITISQCSPAYTTEMYAKLINLLEHEGLLSREVEFLPSQADMNKLVVSSGKLTRPELAVLLSYSKTYVYNQLISSKMLGEKYFERFLLSYFPSQMQQFADMILLHPLRKEIIATIITNKIVNQIGGVVVSSIHTETGASFSDISRAFFVICEIFELDKMWDQVAALGSTVDAKIQIELFSEINKLWRRGIFWLLRNNKESIQIEESIEAHKGEVLSVIKELKSYLYGDLLERYKNKTQRYKSSGISTDLANKIALLDWQISCFDIIRISESSKVPTDIVGPLYFELGLRMHLDWLRKSSDSLINESYWNRLSIQSLKDDIYDKHRRLLIKILQDNQEKPHIGRWLHDKADMLGLFTDFIEDLKSQETIDFNMLVLAVKKLEVFLQKS